LLQIRIRGWISENSQHRDNLAFVVKRVGYHVQQDESRTPKFTAPIHWTLCERSVKLLFTEIVQISSHCLAYSALGSQQGFHRRAVFFAPADKSLVLQILHPAFLTG